MTDWQPGMLITANRLKTFTAEETNSGLTLESPFTLNDFWARKVGGSVTVMVYVNLAPANQITTTSSTTTNILDTEMATLPSGWRPPDTVSAIWSTGVTAGEATIAADGQINLRTTGYNQPVSGNIRLTSAFAL